MDDVAGPVGGQQRHALPRRQDARPGRGPRQRLEGVVEEGVEAGAVVLRTDDGRTWLVGRACRDLLGHRVRLVAAERLGVVTTAQQGPPLAVEDVEDLGPV